MDKSSHGIIWVASIVAIYKAEAWREISMPLYTFALGSKSG